jgi:RecA-family ATPase
MEIIKKTSILKVKTANEWIQEAQSLPVPKQIFGQFWYQGELCVLVADTNQGKTILLVQVIDSVTSGKSILGQENRLGPTKAIYYDLELTSKQFELRYSEINETEGTTFNHFNFSNDFYRGEFNPDGFDFEDLDFTDKIIQEIENQTLAIGANVIVIDNLSVIMPDNEKAKNTTPFLTKLNMLKKKYGWSIILIAHTPKRISYSPMTVNDIQGSKAFSNLVDSIFALGESQKNSAIKYLKQLKVRYGSYEYDSKNVLEIKISKESNFTSFIRIGVSHEFEHLKKIDETSKECKKELAFDLKSKGFSNVHIAEQIGMSEGGIRKWFKKNKEVIKQEIGDKNL